MVINLNTLAAKGTKREEAILALGSDKENIEITKIETPDSNKYFC